MNRRVISREECRDEKSREVLHTVDTIKLLLPYLIPLHRTRPERTVPPYVRKRIRYRLLKTRAKVFRARPSIGCGPPASAPRAANGKARPERRVFWKLKANLRLVPGYIIR